MSRKSYLPSLGHTTAYSLWFT